MEVESSVIIRAFASSMTAAKLRPVTIEKRLRVIHRLATYLDETSLLAATLKQLQAFQLTFAHLAPASVNIYTRHIRALYAWAFDAGWIEADTASRLRIPRVPKGVPHPTSRDDLRLMIRCAPSHLRRTYILAAFAGLRCGEIARLRYEGIIFDDVATAIIDGKGGKQRTVPLLRPVVEEIGEQSKGWVVTRPDGQPWTPGNLSIESTIFLHSIGVMTTLHGCRHFYGTSVAKLTKNPLLVRDLLGHESVQTTEIYMQSDTSNAHAELSGLSAVLDAIRRPAA